MNCSVRGTQKSYYFPFFPLTSTWSTRNTDRLSQPARPRFTKIQSRKLHVRTKMLSPNTQFLLEIYLQDALKLRVNYSYKYRNYTDQKHFMFRSNEQDLRRVCSVEPRVESNRICSQLPTSRPTHSLPWKWKKGRRHSMLLGILFDMVFDIVF